MLSKEAIEEFKKLYKQRFKKELSDFEVARKASGLLNLYRAIYGFVSFDQPKQDNQKNKD